MLLAALLIAHVTVLDMNGAPPRRDVAVVIDGDRVSIQKRPRVPPGAKVVDAAGAFLIPGLWDMHAHLGDGAFDRDANLPLFVANGVTGIRIMEGAPEFHRWREDVVGFSGAAAAPLSDRALAPRMVIASPFVTSVDDVRKAKAEESDFIKIHDEMPRETYFAILKEAKRVGLTVVGHVPSSVTAEEASRAGQRSIEHLTGTNASSSFATFVRNGTWHCPTLIMRHNYALLNDPRLVSDPRLRYAKPSWRARWLRMANEAREWPQEEAAKRRETIAREDALVGAMARAGVGILAGTDDANPFVLPGFGLHDELALLVGAGLTPLEALRAATVDPQKFLGIRGRADFVLLDANPLEDIRNVRAIRAVVLDGRYLDRRELDAILARVEAAAAN